MIIVLGGSPLFSVGLTGGSVQSTVLRNRMLKSTAEPARCSPESVPGFRLKQTSSAISFKTNFV